jgi:hypothetical protein
MRNRTSGAYSPDLNANIGTIINPTWSQYTDNERIVTEQDLTASYADYGPEIDMRGFNVLGIFLIADVNDSENVNLKALVKHTFDHVDEYDIVATPIALWTTGASDFKRYYEINIGAAPIVQLQAIAGTVGATAGDLTIGIVKKYI